MFLHNCVRARALNWTAEFTQQRVFMTGKKGQISLQHINVGHNWHIQPPHAKKRGCRKILITLITLLPALQCSHAIPSNIFCGVFIWYVNAMVPDCIWRTVSLCHLIWSLKFSTSKFALSLKHTYFMHFKFRLARRQSV